MKAYPNMTVPEGHMMEIIWQYDEVKSSVITQEIQKILPWSRQTVRTYIKRLMDKGMVGSRNINQRVFIYFATVSKSQYIVGKAVNLLREYGSPLSIITEFLISQNFSNKDLDTVKKIINNIKL